MSDTSINDFVRDPEDCEEGDEFRRYIEDGTPMEREMTHEEATWVYLNLK